MWRLIVGFFAVLGVIFFLIIIAGVYLFVADPFNLRSFVTSTPSTLMEPSGAALENGSTSSSTGAHPLLSPQQEKALETIGVNPATLPSRITPKQEACFESVLGTARVAEIKNGALPTATEFLKAKECL